MIKTTTWTVIGCGDISDVASEHLGKPYNALDGVLDRATKKETA